MDILDWINKGNKLEAEQKERDLEEIQITKDLKAANKATSPFEFITSIQQDKNYIFEDKNAKHYAPHVVNMGLSQHAENITVCRNASRLQLNLSGLYTELANKMHYDYLFNSIRQGRRYGKWAKVKQYESLDLIMKTYKVNRDEGINILDRLTDEEVNALIEWEATRRGGLIK